MPERDALASANAAYAESFAAGDLPRPPARGLAVVTCMDARLDPARICGLEPGDAHVIRNAGGLVTEDALRSLVISHWLLGTREVAVIAHTDCGMLTFANDDLRRKLAEEMGADASDVDFRPFRDLEASVRESLRTVRDSRLLPDSLEVSGWIYDVHSGRLAGVSEPAGVRD
ncbi:MAG TPA: carbonic anhydrase [Gaiellaceae bacterium]|nr:carbonic anhydrase [Gaiellaceae bacterium]